MILRNAPMHPPSARDGGRGNYGPPYGRQRPGGNKSRPGGNMGRSGGGGGGKKRRPRDEDYDDYQGQKGKRRR